MAGGHAMILVMSEFRQDPLSGRWFVLAAERSKRPEAFYRPPRPRDEGTNCPFCPGHEEQTTPEVLRFSNPDGSWAVRVVPNKYAYMPEPSGVADVAGDPLHRHQMSAGFAEVLIESPDHDVPFDGHSPEQARLVVQAARDRYRALVARPGVAMAMVFRNYLPQSGASLLHPHSQILASSRVPALLEAEVRCFEAWAAREGTCLGCALLEAESAGPRAVAETGGFVILAPYASRHAYELLLLPRQHAPDFGAASDAGLAEALRDAFGRIRRLLGDPPSNMWIHSRPQGHIGDYHWHVHLTPRLTVEGGWELGTGLSVNVIPPEQAAADLRAAGTQAASAIGAGTEDRAVAG